MTDPNKPLFHACNDAVYQRPRRGVSMGFLVCVVPEYVSADDDTSGAAEVARLMNLGEAAKEALAALKAIVANHGKEAVQTHLDGTDLADAVAAIAKLEG